MPQESSPLSDQELLRRIQARDHDAFALLFERHQRPIAGFLVRMTGDPHIAQDLAQEVFLSLLEQAGSYDASRPFRPWLYAIARNHAVHALERRERRNVPLSALPSAKQPRQPGEDSSLRRETEEALWRSLQALPPSLREAVVLRYLQGLPYPEVAVILGIREGTARERVSEALRRLREDLAR